MDLSTEYMGLKLKHPIIASSSLLLLLRLCRIPLRESNYWKTPVLPLS